MSAFYKYFKENMDSLNLPAPESLFGSYQAAIATTSQIAGTLKTLGAGATMLEIAWAFWKYLGEYGFLALTVLAFAALFADNQKLRKRLKDLGEK